MMRSLLPSRSLLLWLVLTLVHGLPASAKKIVDRTLVRVNDEVILQSDLHAFQHRLESKSFRELFGPNSESALKDRKVALQLLVEEKVIDQQIKRLELRASEQEINGRIQSIREKHNISEGQLKEQLHHLGTSMEDYRFGIKRQIERKNLVEREIRPGLEMSDEKLRIYYESQGGNKSSEMQYRIAQLLVDNTSRTGSSPEKRVKQIEDELKEKPEAFAELVKQYSDDNTTTEAGGDMGYFSLSALNQAFRNVVPKTPVGKITAPVKTAAGYHFIKVLDARKGDFNTLSKEEKDSLRNVMISQELERKMATWLEKKKREAYIHKTTSDDSL